MFPGGSSIIEQGETTDAFVQQVDENYFDVLGVRVSRGRSFRSLGEPAAVISDAYWRRHFGASDSALGSRFRYGSNDFTIVGIGPPKFRGIVLDIPTDVWVPVDAVVPPGSPDRLRGRSTLIVGRLRPRATVLQVQSLARTLLGRPIRFAPASNGYSALRGSLTQPLAIVGCAILLVLAITCVNLASLMLADSASRARELAVRKAMGASRARIVRQLLFESLAPSLFGSILALLVGYELNAALLKFLPPDQSPALANLHFTVDVRLLAFTLLLAVLTCACFAAVPALIGTAGNETEEFRAGASTEDSRTRAYLRRALLVGEIAISTMIMVAGGVFLRSERNLRHQHTGFREAGVVVAGVSFPRDYDEARRRLSIDAMVRRIGKLPGVSDVAFSSTGQLSGQGIEFTIGTTARPLKDSSSAVATQLRVSPHFLGAMGTRLMAGRDFTLDDDEGHPPVGIVNQEFARRFLAPGDPIGQRFVEASASPPLHPIEVVGVVEDTKWHKYREQPPPIYYRPYRQAAPRAQSSFRCGQRAPLMNWLRLLLERFVHSIRTSS